MSIEVMTNVWKYSEHSGTELLLLLAIADNADDQGFAFPGRPYLAKKMRMSERTVQRLRQKLYESGELSNIKGGNFKGDRLTVRILVRETDSTLRETDSTLRETDSTIKGDRLTEKDTQFVSLTVIEPSIEPSITVIGDEDLVLHEPSVAESDKDFAIKTLAAHSANPIPSNIQGERRIDMYLDAHAAVVALHGPDKYCAAVITSKTDRYKSMHNPQHLEELINLAAAEYVPIDYDPIEVMEGVDDVGY